MNEWTFLLQVFLVVLFSYGAFRLGEAALTGAIAVQAIIANLFVLKQMSFLGLNVTCSDAYVIGSILCLNLLREYYGRDSAKKATQISFFLMVFVVALSQMHLRFVPSAVDTAHLAYARILSPAPRLLIASLGVFYLVQQLDIRLFGWISKVLPRSNFSLRSTLSTTCTQLVDTVLFSFLGLYGLVAKVSDIIVVSFLVKLCVVLCMTPLLGLFRKVNHRV